MAWHGASACCRLLLLGLLIAGCAQLPFLPTPGPAPTATDRPLPAELLGTAWQLDHLLVNGEVRPPYHEGQCFEIGSRPDSMYYYDGCNHGYCDLAARRSSSENLPPGATLCSQTLALCIEEPTGPGTPGVPVKWDKAFSESIRGYRQAELHDAELRFAAAGQPGTILVFRRMDGSCEGAANYMQP